jgi:serine/threonine-protein kinase
MKRAEPPSRLGRYPLLKVRGKGAMGVVYEALDPRLSRSFAIKTILLRHLIDDGTACEYSSRCTGPLELAAPEGLRDR